MRRKFALLLLLISLAALPFSGCADAQEKQQDEQTQQTALQDTPDFQQADLPEEQQGVHEQIDALWAQLDTSELPRLNFTPLYRPFEEEFSIEDWPLQVLYPQDKTAYQLAAQICNLTYYYIGNVLPDFEEEPTWNMDDAMLLTALYRTTPINLGDWETPGNGISSFADHPDHLISAIINEYEQDGRYISSVYYVEDVEEIIHFLFGKDVEVYHQDCNRYYYSKRGGIYLQTGDYGGPIWPYAQITSYQQTEDGYLCEAVIVRAYDTSTPPWVYSEDYESIYLTEENFEQLTADLTERYRYTFRWEDGNLILRGLQKIS